jgi:hypothetical protein
MNPPGFITRFLGTPLVAAALYVVCAAAMLGWTRGEVPWWLALAAVCFVGTVRKAVQDLRRYKQWYTAWQGMGSAEGVAVQKRKASPRWVTAAALCLLILIPLFIAQPGPDTALCNGLMLLWLGVAAYLLWKLAVSLWRVCSGRRTGVADASGNKTSTPADLVTWMLPRAASSASRAEAVRNVPEYCARLMASH